MLKHEFEQMTGEAADNLFMVANEVYTESDLFNSQTDFLTFWQTFGEAGLFRLYDDIMKKETLRCEIERMKDNY